jgi:hypothetical protein
MAGKSVESQIDHLRPYILALMQRDGRDFEWCEVGEHQIDNGFVIHHTRYDGATYYDLGICCRSCNNMAENVGLE